MYIDGNLQMEHILTIVEVDSQREYVCVATIRGNEPEQLVSIAIRRVQAA